jgi:glycosyltransferase involved in cell wall biosynthesis
VADAIHQLIASATPGDAVTHQALAWQRVLAGHGVGGEIYAENVAPPLKGSIRPLRRFPASSGTTAILHYSIGSSVLDAAQRLPRSRLGIVYHNITPAEFLEPVNPTVAVLCARGRNRLPTFADRAAVVIADSQFNADELRGVGYTDVTVIPLLLSFSVHRPVRETALPALLSVGRLVPNKRLEDVIRTLGLVKRHHLADARLTIVGAATGFELYAEALQRFAHAIGMEDAVTFTGGVSDAERDTAYADAGVYVCLSEHEGFCAPLVESFANGLPVVAGDAGAIPETLGGAGISIPNRDPVIAAEAVAAVLSDRNLRATLAQRMTRRLSELAPARIEEQFIAAVAPLLG